MITLPTMPPKSTVPTRAAVILTEVASPAVLVTALLMLISWHNAPDLGRGFLWVAIAVAFGTVIPMAFIYYGVRRKRWSDHHVPEHEKRMLPMIFGCTSIGIGYLLLAVTNAPHGIITVYTAMILEAVVLTAITKFWKISAHVAAAASCATVLSFVYGPALIATWLIVPVVAWARVQVRRHSLAQGSEVINGHTIPQTIAGALVAADVVSTVYVVM